MLKSLVKSAVNVTTIIASAPALFKLEMIKAKNEYELALIKEECDRAYKEQELKNMLGIQD